MDEPTTVRVERARGIYPSPPLRRPLWRRVFLNPAFVAFTVLALIIWAAILIAPSAGAAGGCGGG